VMGMKQLNIKYYEILEAPIEFQEFFLKQKLRNAGFDFSKTITVFEDYPNFQIIYTQEEKSDERDKRKGRIKMELQRLWSCLAR
jgi:hypothetical protein